MSKKQRGVTTQKRTTDQRTPGRAPAPGTTPAPPVAPASPKPTRRQSKEQPAEAQDDEAVTTPA